MKKNDTAYLHHILDAIADIEDYSKDITYDDFMKRKMVQDSVAYRLQIIGEASRNLSDEIRNKYQQILWKQIIALRNKIVHEYFDIDLDVIWDIIRNDLPSLKQSIKLVLNEIVSES